MTRADTSQVDTKLKGVAPKTPVNWRTINSQSFSLFISAWNLRKILAREPPENSERDDEPVSITTFFCFVFLFFFLSFSVTVCSSGDEES